jgi:hypothetical protein
LGDFLGLDKIKGKILTLEGFDLLLGLEIIFLRQGVVAQTFIESKH